jgi:alpha-N-arabinofuranosidase
MPHEGYVVAKARPAGARLTVGLVAGGRTLAETTVGPLTEEWQRYSFVLPALGEAANAEVRIVAGGSGTVWLGAASLMPADNLGGWRADVVEVLRAVRPATIRWPGGNFASQYDWREGIGERDKRPCRWNRAWNQWEWNDVGTDEFLRLCELLGAEPYICANAGEGTPQEAAEWVEYCNGPADTPMGRLRAANGHPAPYGVRLWGLGNEMYGNWHHGWLDGSKYGLKAAQMAAAMRAVDTALELVLVGVDVRGWDNFNEKAIQKAGLFSNYLSVHYYLGLDVNADQLAEYARALAAPVDVERMLQATWEVAREANAGTPIPICFDEWNVWRPEVDDQPGYKGFYCLREGLFAGEILNALNRLGPKVPIACVTQSVNVLGLIRANETSVAPTPSYWVLKLFRDRAGKLGLPVQYEGPTAVFPSGSLPLVDATATYDPEARRLSILMVNRSAAEAREVRIEVPWAERVTVSGVSAVTADDYLAANDYAQPDAVVARNMPELVEAAGAAAEVTIPKHSVVAVDFELTNPRFGG